MRQITISMISWLVIASTLTSPVWGEAPREDWFPKAPPLPKPSGQVIRVASVPQLLQAVKAVKPGGTILIADGHYRVGQYFAITKDHVTLRSASGDRHKVIIDGTGSRHGELLGVAGCKGATIADLTIQNIKWNGFKIVSHANTHEVTIHNCVIHNIWQRGVKASAVPKDKQHLSPRGCKIQFCLFYNDRPKQFSDDETDTNKTYNGNYIGGIDVKNTIDWRITDNVFAGIKGRTREGRGCIYISENGRGCVIERNIFIDSDIAIALGNPALGYSPLHAIDCIARNNLISQCPETGILACYTKDCRIENNTVVDPKSPRRRLIWVQLLNEGLKVTNNLVVGSPIQVTSKSDISMEGNVAVPELSKVTDDLMAKSGQQQIALATLPKVVALPSEKVQNETASAKALLEPGIQSDACLKAMKKLHEGFKGQAGYVAQFGDSITYSMAFWAPMDWSDPTPFITIDDGLPKSPVNKRWRDIIKGTRAKGSQHGNYSGWTVGQMLRAMDKVLEKEKPEVAVIMIGTNDISGGRIPERYGAQLEEAIKKCLNAHCIPILNTIPPRRKREKAVAATNVIIRATAKKFNVPLADFHHACVSLQPDGAWDGTVIAKDGVHPSGGKSNVYTEDNMKQCGYALRNWVNFLVLRQLHFRALHPSPSK